MMAENSTKRTSWRLTAFTCRFMAVMFVCMLVSESATATIIRLREKVNSTSTLITLGDVAEISEASTQEIEKLKQLTIAPAPGAGRTVKISIDRIRRELTLRGVNQSNLTFLGASQSLVQSQQILQNRSRNFNDHESKKNLAAITNAIRTYIQRQSSELTSVDVTIDSQQSQLDLRGFDQSTAMHVQGGQAPWTGLQRLQVSFINKQGSRQNFLLVCNIVPKQQVLALKFGLPRGKVIREADLVWIDPAQNNRLEPTFSNPNEVVGTETKRNVRAQIPIRPEDIRQLPLIKRNDIVAVTARIGGVVVRRYCKSHDEGTKGQFITLTPVDGKGKVTARVSGFREAEITFNDLSAPVKKSTIQNARYSEPVRQSSNQGLQVMRPEQKKQNKLLPPVTQLTPPIQQQQQQNYPVRNPSFSSKNRPQIRAKIQANRPVQLPE